MVGGQDALLREVKGLKRSSAGVVCRPQHTAVRPGLTGSTAQSGSGNCEVEPEARGSECRARENSFRPGRKARPQRISRSSAGASVELRAWRRMVAARGLFPARRERGCRQTEPAVGRHRLRANESSVVKAHIIGPDPRGESGRDGIGESRGKIDRPVPTTKPVSETSWRWMWEPGAGGRRPGGAVVA